MTQSNDITQQANKRLQQQLEINRINYKKEYRELWIIFEQYSYLMLDAQVRQDQGTESERSKINRILFEQYLCFHTLFKLLEGQGNLCKIFRYHLGTFFNAFNRIQCPIHEKITGKTNQQYYNSNNCTLIQKHEHAVEIEWQNEDIKTILYQQKIQLSDLRTPEKIANKIDKLEKQKSRIDVNISEINTTIATLKYLRLASFGAVTKKIDKYKPYRTKKGRVRKQYQGQIELLDDLILINTEQDASCKQHVYVGIIEYYIKQEICALMLMK